MAGQRKQRNPVYAKRVWQRLRLLALQRDRYECQECKRQGKHVPARLVHHIVPVEARPDMAYELDNLESVCFACHEQLHPEKQQKRRAVQRAQAALREDRPEEKGPLLARVRVMKL